MSNLLKSKFVLGFMVALVMFVGVVSIVGGEEASAANCTITKTLRMGSKGDEVKCLQSALGLKADGSFGKGTKTAVVAFQTKNSLKADGVFGAKANAVWMGSTMTPPGTVPPGTVPPVVQTGPVTASLASNTPASGYIIGNQATAPLLNVTFTGNGTVNTVVLHRSGVSDQNTLSNVYLFDGSTRLTDGYSFNNSGDLTMNNLGIVVNGSRTISVKADVAALQSASTLSLTLTSFTTVGGTATTVNIAGNMMTYGTGSLASAYVLTQTASANSSVNAGTSAYTLWSAPVQANTRTIWLKGANFRIVGSAPADALGNVKLFVDGAQVGSAATMATITGSNYAMFDFSAAPVALTTGSHTVDLRADIVKGSSYTVQVSLQQASDLVLYDGQIGANIAATTDAGHTLFSANSAGTITINAGSASVNVDPSFQVMTNITGGSTNATIAKFKVHGYGEDVKVSTLTVTPLVATGTTTGSTCTTTSAGVTNGGTCGLNNVTIFFNGSQVGSSQNLSSANMGSPMSFNLGSQMILPAGADSTIEVRADLQTSASVNYITGNVSANLILGVSNAQGQTSHTTLAFPGSSVTGTILAVQSGQLAVSKNASYLAQTVNANIASVKVGSFTVQNQSSSEGVRVTNLAVGLSFVTPTYTSGTVTAGSQAVTVSSSAGFTVGNIITIPGATAAIGTVTAVTDATHIQVNFTTGGVTPTAGGAITGSGTTSGPATITNLSNLRTSETSGSGNTPIQPSATNNFSVNFTLLPGETRTIDVIADLGAANMGTVTATLGTTAIGASSNVTVLQNGAPGTAVSGQVITLGSGTVALPTVVTSTTSTAQYVAAGTVSGVKDIARASYNIVASNGSATISELKFDTASNTGAITAVRVGSSTAAMVSNIAYLTGLSIPVVNGGAGANIDAYVSFAPVGTTGIASNTSDTLRLCYVKYTIGGTTSTVGSAACGGPTTAGYPVSSGQAMTIVGSKPTITVATPTGVVVSPSASIEAIDVTVTADAAGPINVVSIPINTTIAGLAATTANFTTANFTVKDSGNNTIATATGGCGSTTACTNVTLTLNGTAGYQISAGQSQTFKVFVNTGAYTVPTTQLPNTYLYTSIGGTGTLSWLDTAGSNATAITGTSLIYNYPNTFTSGVHN